MTRAQLLKILPQSSESFLQENASDAPVWARKASAATLPFPVKKSLVAGILERNLAIPDPSIKFTIPLSLIGAPRMTQCDKWKKRSCVVRYREWRDAARPYVPTLPSTPSGLNWTAYVAFPKSYSAKKRASLAGKLHQEKPDSDNATKLIFDFLFEQDKGIAFGSFCKRWDDGNGPRIEIEVIP